MVAINMGQRIAGAPMLYKQVVGLGRVLALIGIGAAHDLIEQGRLGSTSAQQLLGTELLAEQCRFFIRFLHKLPPFLIRFPTEQRVA